jgi:hypothetical protein
MKKMKKVMEKKMRSSNWPDVIRIGGNKEIVM